MFILYFVLWVALNGRWTTEVGIFGLIISAGMYWFTCKYMNYKPSTDLKAIKKLGFIIVYLFTLLSEVIKANIKVITLVLSRKIEIEPELVYFKTDLKSEVARVVLANSITLTPGTVTVLLEDDVYCVHCLDKNMAHGIEENVFVRMLRKMESPQEEPPTTKKG